MKVEKWHEVIKFCCWKNKVTIESTSKLTTSIIIFIISMFSYINASKLHTSDIVNPEKLS
jgi:hypothetical protein